MKILTLIFTFFTLIPFASADCYRLLTQNHSRDSYAYQMSEDAVSYEVTRGTPEFAHAAVKALGQQVGCQPAGAEKANKIEITSVSCQDVVPGVHTSRVCYVEGEFGYFLVSVDMLENINVVFNRFD